VSKVHLPAAYDKPVLYAVRAWFEGEASKEQQLRAKDWLMFNLCHIGMPSYAETDRDTAFLEGQRSVGLQLARLREPEALALIEKAARPKRKPRQEANG